MFYLNHRSIKVTLFSEIHIKIISKIILTYHQIAPTYAPVEYYSKFIFPVDTLIFVLIQVFFYFK